MRGGNAFRSNLLPPLTLGAGDAFRAPTSLPSPRKGTGRRETGGLLAHIAHATNPAGPAVAEVAGDLSVAALGLIAVGFHGGSTVGGGLGTLFETLLQAGFRVLWRGK